jgi:NAD(P)-dependent dehydrogenase (short-subunit alcohol dehydrogenase family)
MKIEGCVALVTGANRGLGRALVAALVEAGAAKVYAAARDERTLREVGGRVVPVRLDTGKPEEVAAAAKKAHDVNLLINNAGAMNSLHVLTTSPEALEADFRTNVLGTLGVIKAFLPGLERAAGGSTIVNVLSLASLASLPSMGGYAASKAASYSVTQSLRPGLKAKGIDILAVLPGPIDTDMVKMLQIPKTSPAATAAGIVAGIGRGDEEIFPDPMAVQMGALWSNSPKEYERVLSQF